MRVISRMMVSASTLLLCACAQLSTPPSSVSKAPKPKSTVTTVDLTRYMGKWYEIAAYPNTFERDCQCNMAEYTPLKDNQVKVTNSCVKGKNHHLSRVSGKATPVPNTGNTQLNVQFFWLFRGNYWILALDKDYTYTLVGSPDRNYLWVLARKPTLGEAELKQLKEIAKELGYEPEKLVLTPQTCEK